MILRNRILNCIRIYLFLVRGRGGARGRAMAAGTTRPPMPSPGKPPMPGTGRGDPQQISQTMSKMTLAPVGPPQPQPPRGPPAPGNISLFRF